MKAEARKKTEQWRRRGGIKLNIGGRGEEQD
jgi:hypothetical protein